MNSLTHNQIENNCRALWFCCSRQHYLRIDAENNLIDFSSWNLVRRLFFWIKDSCSRGKETEKVNLLVLITLEEMKSEFEKDHFYCVFYCRERDFLSEYKYFCKYNDLAKKIGEFPRFAEVAEKVIATVGDYDFFEDVTNDTIKAEMKDQFYSYLSSGPTIPYYEILDRREDIESVYLGIKLRLSCVGRGDNDRFYVSNEIYSEWLGRYRKLREKLV